MNRAYLLCQHFLLSPSTYLVFNLSYSSKSVEDETERPVQQASNRDYLTCTPDNTKYGALFNWFLY